MAALVSRAVFYNASADDALSSAVPPFSFESETYDMPLI